MTTRYTCNFAGECEYDPNGQYPSIDACQADCQGANNRDLLYKISTYDLDLIRQLAPSDQIESLYRLYGVRLAPHEAELLLVSLTTDTTDPDLVDLTVQYPSLKQVIDRYFPLIRQIIEMRLNFYYLSTQLLPTYPVYSTYGTEVEGMFDEFVRTGGSNITRLIERLNELFLSNYASDMIMSDREARDDIRDIVIDYLPALRVWSQNRNDR